MVPQTQGIVANSGVVLACSTSLIKVTPIYAVPQDMYLERGGIRNRGNVT